MAQTLRVPADSVFYSDAKVLLLGRLGSITPESERRWGRMSSHQMVCHLSDMLRLALGERPVQPIGGMLERTIVKWIALHTPLSWPRGKIRSASELDQQATGTRPEDFYQDVAELERLIGRFVASERELEGRDHPMFGKLAAWEWGRFQYRHMDHHLRQFGA